MKINIILFLILLYYHFYLLIWLLWKLSAKNSHIRSQLSKSNIGVSNNYKMNGQNDCDYSYLQINCHYRHKIFDWLYPVFIVINHVCMHLFHFLYYTYFKIWLDQSMKNKIRCPVTNRHCTRNKNFF